MHPDPIGEAVAGVRPGAKFVIISPARSGSTLLRQILNRHTDICCHGEVFGIHRVLGHSVHASQSLDSERALAVRRRDPVKFLDDYVFSSQRPVVGFKLLYPQLFHFEFVPVLERLLALPELRVVMLWRRNLIARHVSEVRLRFGNKERPHELPVEKLEVALRPAAVERSCRANLAARACALKLFDGHATIHLDYEKLIADYAMQSQELCRFLGVDGERCPALPAKADEPPDPIIVDLERMAALDMYRDHP